MARSLFVFNLKRFREGGIRRPWKTRETIAARLSFSKASLVRLIIKNRPYRRWISDIKNVRAVPTGPVVLFFFFDRMFGV